MIDKKRSFTEMTSSACAQCQWLKPPYAACTVPGYVCWKRKIDGTSLVVGDILQERAVRKEKGRPRVVGHLADPKRYAGPLIRMGRGYMGYIKRPSFPPNQDDIFVYREDPGDAHLVVCVGDDHGLLVVSDRMSGLFGPSRPPATEPQRKFVVTVKPTSAGFLGVHNSHKADGFHLTANGDLVISAGGCTLAVYAAGTWHKIREVPNDAV